MPLLSLMILLIIVGVGLWLVNTYIPMAAPIKTILKVVVIIVVVIFLLQAFGVWGGMNAYRFGR